MLRHLDLFSGIGGFALAARMVGGYETVGFCEIEPYCQAVLRKHWPGVPIYDDVRSFSGVGCDVLTGGFPCQPFSSAARGRNNATDLWPHMLRITTTCRARWVLAENVPGLSLAGVDRVCGDFENADYTVWPFDLDTALPTRQRGRRRYMFVAYANREGEPRRAFDEAVAGVSALSGYDRRNDPAPVGMDDELPGRMDRLKCLGNAVTPWCAATFLEAIKRVTP